MHPLPIAMNYGESYFFGHEREFIAYRETIARLEWVSWRNFSSYVTTVASTLIDIKSYTLSAY